MKHDYVGSRGGWVKISQHRPNFKNVYAGIVRQDSEMKARWCGCSNPTECLKNYLCSINRVVHVT